MKKTLSQILLTFIIFNLVGILGLNVAYAQNESIGGTLLPQAESSFVCVDLFSTENPPVRTVEGELNKLENQADPVKYVKEQLKTNSKYLDNVLACAIKSGKIHFWMIPYFIVYFIEFMIGLSGLVAILFIVIGGFQLVLSGATDQKDNAKNTIKNALMGLVLVLVAWVVVNVVQYVVTI